MRKSYVVSVSLIVVSLFSIAFKAYRSADYSTIYYKNLALFKEKQQQLLQTIDAANLGKSTDIEEIKSGIASTRKAMKGMDFWMRYLEPTIYKKINGPLPVEWETEAFEKFEKPYKREGAGLTLAALYLEEKNLSKDSLRRLITLSLSATDTYAADSMTNELNSYHHFYLCNRLFLLNLAAIYTTGFECPDADAVIPELRTMISEVNKTYNSFNNSFPEAPLPPAYLALADSMQHFVDRQPSDNTHFDHFTFIRDYVNPLFIINQGLIKQYHVVSRSMIDYCLNKQAQSIFDKRLYNAQNPKGVYLRVDDTGALAQIEEIGRLLFYDPVLSGNNQRSCASCHKPTEYFTDTVVKTALHFNHTDILARNSPSLINSIYNQLLMLDGRHTSLVNQATGVINNPDEMNCAEAEVVKKVLSCSDYRRAFKQLLTLTPQEKEITLEHIVSAVTFYYSKFSSYYSAFDDAMNKAGSFDREAREGFNLFMGKAQCGTCHFVPQFNGVKPPFISSEFEVLGVPADTAYRKMSIDSGRYAANPAPETRNAFRTGSLRNIMHTSPYMHNGVFSTMEQVIDFYNKGGGAGHGFQIANQTLSSDLLKLTDREKKQLIAFMRSLDEQIIFERAPEKLPRSSVKALNNRKPGGEY